MRRIKSIERSFITPGALRSPPEEAHQGPEDDVDVEDEPDAQDDDRHPARPELPGESFIENPLTDERREHRHDQADERKHGRVGNEAKGVDPAAEVLERDEDERDDEVDAPPDEVDLLDVGPAEEAHGRIGVLPDDGLAAGHPVVEEEEPGHDQEEDGPEGAERLPEEEGLVLDDLETTRHEPEGTQDRVRKPDNDEDRQQAADEVSSPQDEARPAGPDPPPGEVLRREPGDKR